MKPISAEGTMYSAGDRHIGSTRPAKSGLIIFTTLIVIAMLTALSAAGLNRSVTELRAAERYAFSQQAFYLAEGGLDAKLVELLDVEDGNDTQALAALQSTGSYTVTVSAEGLNTWRLDARGQASQVGRDLMLLIQRETTFGAPAAVTVVDQGASGISPKLFKAGRPNLMEIDGCDGDGGECVPGLLLTSKRAYDDFSVYVRQEETRRGPIGARLRGRAGESGLTNRVESGNRPGQSRRADYSVKKISDSARNYEWINSLGEFAKAEAIRNGCYITVNNDDDAQAQNVRIKNRALGTRDDPKICYIDAPLLRDHLNRYPNPSGADELPGESEEVHFSGIVRGAGLLVVHGELDQSGSFSYDGVIVSYGPSAEAEFSGHTQIHGSLLLATVEPTVTSRGLPSWIRPELETDGTGIIQYSKSGVATAEDLVADWAAPGSERLIGQDDTTTVVLAWAQRDVSPAMFTSPEPVQIQPTDFKLETLHALTSSSVSQQQSVKGTSSKF